MKKLANLSAATLLTIMVISMLFPFSTYVAAAKHCHKNCNIQKFDCDTNNKISKHSTHNKIGPIDSECIGNSAIISDSTITGSTNQSNGGDITSPTIISTDPKDNENNVPVDIQITVIFSEKIDKNSIDTGSLSLVPDVGNSANIQNVAVNDKTATFTVSGNLLPNTNYLAAISSNVKDTSGNFLDCSGSSGVDSLCQWNFDTGPGSVRPLPPIILTPTPGSLTNNKPLISGTVAGASLTTLKVEVFDGSDSLGTTTADNNGAWSLTPKNALSEGPHTITAVAQSTNNNQKSDPSSPVTFKVTNNPVGPSINLSPPSGTVGSPFTVTGTGFDPNGDVIIEFDGSSGTKKSDNNGNFAVTFGVPISTSGVHNVTASQGSISASKPFTVISSIALNPTSGPVGTPVNITGTGFDPDSNVNLKFDSTSLSPSTTDNKGSFFALFTVPASANGPHNVTATQGSNVASQSFTVTSSASSSSILGDEVSTTNNQEIPSNIFG